MVSWSSFAETFDINANKSYYCSSNIFQIEKKYRMVIIHLWYIFVHWTSRFYSVLAWKHVLIPLISQKKNHKYKYELLWCHYICPMIHNQPYIWWASSNLLILHQVSFLISLNKRWTIQCQQANHPRMPIADMAWTCGVPH